MKMNRWWLSTSSLHSIITLSIPTSDLYVLSSSRLSEGPKHSSITMKTAAWAESRSRPDVEILYQHKHLFCLLFLWRGGVILTSFTLPMIHPGQLWMHLRGQCHDLITIKKDIVSNIWLLCGKTGGLQVPYPSITIGGSASGWCQATSSWILFS